MKTQKTISVRGTIRIAMMLVGSLAVLNDAGHAQSAEVSATGNVSSHSITSAEALRFTMSIRNKSSAALNSVRVVSVPDDYELGQMCALTEQTGTECYDRQALSSSHIVFAPSILPGHSFTTWGYLRPKAIHKTESLTFIVGWTSADSSRTSSPSSIVVNLGENEVLSWFGSYRPAFSETLKSLLIPGTLAIFGTILTVRLKQRDERNARIEKERDAAREKAEKEREEIRQDRQREQALKAETWKQMLPLSHESAAKYYLPASNAAERFIFFLRAKNEKVAFFYMLSLWKWMVEISHGLGGFYFKSLLGEALASECWHEQKQLLLGDDDAPLNLSVKGALVVLGTTETFQSFMTKFGSPTSDSVFQNGDIQPAWDLFCDWTKDDAKVKKLIVILKAFYAVLDYEANRPYEYWYDNPAHLKVTEEAEELLRGIAIRERFSEQEIRTYFEGKIRV